MSRYQTCLFVDYLYIYVPYSSIYIFSTEKIWMYISIIVNFIRLLFTKGNSYFSVAFLDMYFQINTFEI